MNSSKKSPKYGARQPVTTTPAAPPKMLATSPSWSQTPTAPVAAPIVTPPLSKKDKKGFRGMGAQIANMQARALEARQQRLAQESAPRTPTWQQPLPYTPGQQTPPQMQQPMQPPSFQPPGAMPPQMQQPMQPPPMQSQRPAQLPPTPAYNPQLAQAAALRQPTGGGSKLVGGI
jgi:hypothetical protein